MKKKNILNRPMFKQVKSPAYGTGISANLVSDDQRQRYNYGGRVRAADGLDYRFYTPIAGYPDAGTQYASSFIPKTLEDQKKLEQMEWQYPQSVEDIESAVAEYGKVDEQVPWQGVDFDFGLGDTVEKRFQRSEEGKKLYRDKLMNERRELVDERKSVGLYTPGEKGHPSEGIDARWSIPHKGKKEIVDTQTETFEEEDFPGTLHQRTRFKPDTMEEKKTIHDDPMWNSQQDTENIDIEKPTAYETLMSELDKSAEEKKKLGKGNALMQAAAAAVEWSGAGTAKERSAAISKGLTQVGETAMKAAAEGMDLKDKVKILKTMEDVKGGHKMDVWQSKFDNYYKKALEISGEELDFKKLTAKALNEEIPPQEVYKGYIGKGVLSNPLSKAEILGSLIKRDIPVASDDKEKKQFSSPDNDGLIFIDMKGKIWRNTNGDIKSVDVWQDTEFFGE